MTDSEKKTVLEKMHVFVTASFTAVFLAVPATLFLWTPSSQFSAIRALVSASAVYVLYAASYFALFDRI